MIRKKKRPPARYEARPLSWDVWDHETGQWRHLGPMTENEAKATAWSMNRTYRAEDRS